MNTSGSTKEQLLRDLNYLYWSAYHAGHHDTVEGRYTDVVAVDRHDYHADAVQDCINSGDMETVRLAPEPVAWQPIETAPHGRKLILGYHNGCGNWRTVVGKYIKARTLELSDEALDRLDLDIEDGDDRCYAPEGWYETPDNAEFIDFTSDTPTHWMPLPTAPTKAAVRGRWESRGLCGCTGELKNGERPFACEHGFKTELQQPQNGSGGRT